MYKFPEARKYKRTEKRHVTRFQVKPNEDKVFKEWDMVAIANLSAGGIFFYSIENLGVGTTLDLKIGLSHSHHSITCVGRVIRAKRQLDTSLVGFAIQFTEIDEQDKEVINNTVEEK
jgi:hypothetical protein